MCKFHAKLLIFTCKIHCFPFSLGDYLTNRHPISKKKQFNKTDCWKTILKGFL